VATKSSGIVVSGPDFPADAVPLVASFEGFSSKPYCDPTGTWTIGYGLTYQPDGRPVTAFSAPLSKAAALQALELRLKAVFTAVWQLVNVPLTGPMEAALVSFAYNVGVTALAGSTLLKELNQGNYGSAADQFLRWDRSKGVRLPGLTARRQRERETFLKEVPERASADQPEVA